MIGTYKTFNQGLFDQNDTRARYAVLTHISRMGVYAVENPDKYGPDLVLYRGLRPISYVEVEVKSVWRADQPEFPWAEINLPERKEKFLKLGLPIEFWILREDLQMAVILPDYIVEKSPKEEVRNKYNPEGELFRKVPLSECPLIELLSERANVI